MVSSIAVPVHRALSDRLGIRSLSDNSKRQVDVESRERAGICPGLTRGFDVELGSEWKQSATRATVRALPRAVPNPVEDELSI
jgi:hypothetical protein